MTTVADRRVGPLGRRLSSLPTWTVPASVAAAVLCRVPFVGHAAGPDEAGFLLVGAQWNGAGTSLYGNYWVDRPPLLITIYRLAASLGGLTALRLIGCVAAALLVLGASRVAGLMAGRESAQWAALSAAALSINPLLGSRGVNGELLAAPFILGGIAAMIVALRASSRRQAGGAAAVAGALAVCSLLVKQNLADVAVFGTVALILAAWRGDISRQRFTTLLTAATGGALAAGTVLAGWTVIHGTSLVGVFDAMYPFRLHAEQAMAAGGSHHATVRLFVLIGAAAASGLIFLLVVLARDVVVRRPRDVLTWALIATILFDIASVLVGGNYWHHYLVELIGPVSVVVGLLCARRALGARSVLAYVVAAAVLGWAVSLGAPQGSDGQSVGRSIAAVSQPGDAIVSTWGHADVTLASGLSSPYAQLWSLPIKTLDPQLTQLDAVLTGPSAPTWFVSWGHLRTWGLDTARTGKILSRDYRQVGLVCGRTVYLHDGIVRPVPRVEGSCRGTGAPLDTSPPTASTTAR